MAQIGTVESEPRGWARLRRAASGLRARLLLLVLLAVIPALGLILYTTVRWRQHEALEAQADAWRLARHVVAVHERRITETRDMLRALGQLPAAQGTDPLVCRESLSRTLEEFRFYANLGILRVDGELFCSALPVERAAITGERSAFRKAIEAHGYSAGDPRVDVGSGRILMDFAAPIPGRDGGVRAVAFAVLDLAWLGGLIEEADLPGGTTVTLFDEKGAILAHYPGPVELVGRSAAGEAIFRLIRLSPWGGTADEIGLDGSRRLFGFQPMLDPSKGGSRMRRWGSRRRMRSRGPTGF